MAIAGKLCLGFLAAAVEGEASLSVGRELTRCIGVSSGEEEKIFNTIIVPGQGCCSNKQPYGDFLECPGEVRNKASPPPSPTV